MTFLAEFLRRTCDYFFATNLLTFLFNEMLFDLKNFELICELFHLF